MTQLLNDAELDRIMEAAWMLHPSQRAAFEQQVITELQKLAPDVRGPGTLHRIIAAAQRSFLRVEVGPGNLSCYDKPSVLRAKGK